MTRVLTHQQARPMTAMQRIPPGAPKADPLAYWAERGRAAANEGLSRSDAIWCSEPMRPDRRAAYMRGFDDAARCSVSRESVQASTGSAP